MKKRINFLLILIFIFIISVSATASAREITVDDDSGADFVSIQDAVNNSVPGDTIIVRPGTYTENVLVNTTGLTIRSESNNGDVQVKPLNESVSTFLIEANSTTISGLNITGASEDFGKRAIVIYSDMNKLTGNTIEKGSIELGSERSGNIIAENKISDGEEGIHISCCGINNTVSGNTISNCSTGIYEFDQGADIRNNRITDCHNGIALTIGSSGEIDNNTILNCDVGIRLGEGSYPTIINNKIMYCVDCGIFGEYNEGGKRIYNNYFNNTLNVRFGTGEGGNTWNNSLTMGTNIIGGPYIGGNFWAKPDGTGFSQTCADVDGNGIGDLPYNIYEDEFDYLPLASRSNLVTPTANFTASVTNGIAPLSVQFTDNSENAAGWHWDFGDGNTSTEPNPTHIYPEPGNYIVNLTVSNSNGSDSKLATITVSEKTVSVLPVANFSSNLTSGNAPLTVQFTDLSQNATAWNWNFGDGANSTLQNPIHTYSAAGNYVVNLISSNANGTSSKTATITVLESGSGDNGSGGESSHSSGGSSHSSGGSGGGGGGSPEPARNVKVKEISQTFITNGNTVKFDFTKNATSVLYLSFGSKKTAGKTTTTVEMLRNKSTLTPDSPEGEVYNYLNIWVGNGGYGSNENNLENAVICFKVEKSWAQDKNLDKSSITLKRYNNKKWNELPTSCIKEDDKYLYFTAKTPGFSPFAITGKTKAIGTEIQSVAEDKQNNAEKTTVNIDQTPEKTQSSNTSENEGFNTSDLKRASVLVCLLCLMIVFMFKMK